MTDIVKRLRNPDFGTETTDRNIMTAAADEIERLRERLRISETPPCFACGAKITEKCKRHPDKDCGREHFGGTRQALENKP